MDQCRLGLLVQPEYMYSVYLALIRLKKQFKSAKIVMYQYPNEVRSHTFQQSNKL